MTTFAGSYPAPTATDAAEPTGSPGAATTHAFDPGRLRAFLSAYWLRPENALWMYLRSTVLREAGLFRPWADISCGDGVFTFLHLGGRFTPEFDVFKAVGDLDRVRDEHADMFDCPAADYRPAIVERPACRVDLGTDLKPNLLAKAGALGLYDRLIRTDNNRPLPFTDHSFASVYCNAAYWVVRVEPFLSELKRIVRPGGRVVLHVKLQSICAYTLEAYRRSLGDRFLEIIGRGRTACWPTLADRPAWESRFARTGLRVEQAVPFVTGTHARLWDVGLRPIAPLVTRMANALSPATRASVKRDWVELFFELLRPLCKPDLDLSGGPDEPAEMQYVLIPES